MDNSSTPALTDAAQRSSGSYELVMGPVLMALVGVLLDKWLGTTPLFIVLFTLWGALGAGIGIYFRYRRQIAMSPAPVQSSGTERRSATGEDR